jgi:hypothetical protein
MTASEKKTSYELNEELLRVQLRKLRGDMVKSIIERGIPNSETEFRVIMKLATITELTQMGFGLWGEPDDQGVGLLLFPAEWFEVIPPGITYVTTEWEFKESGTELTDRTPSKHGLLGFGTLKQIW